MAWFIGAQSDLIFVINWDGDMDDRQWLLIWLDMWSNKTSYVACPLVRPHGHNQTLGHGGTSGALPPAQA